MPSSSVKSSAEARFNRQDANFHWSKNVLRSELRPNWKVVWFTLSFKHIYLDQWKKQWEWLEFSDKDFLIEVVFENMKNQTPGSTK